MPVSIYEPFLLDKRFTLFLLNDDYRIYMGELFFRSEGGNDNEEDMVYGKSTEMDTGKQEEIVLVFYGCDLQCIWSIALAYDRKTVFAGICLAILLYGIPGSVDWILWRNHLYL